MPGWQELLQRVQTDTIKAAWVTAGYPTPDGSWCDDQTAAAFDGLDCLVVQDLFDSPLWERATYVLPGAAPAERDGSYVNRADRLQTVPWAIRPPAGVRTEASLYWELLKMEGLPRARAVLDEVARQILYFNAAAGEVPEVGIDLKVNLLAETGEPTV